MRRMDSRSTGRVVAALAAVALLVGSCADPGVSTAELCAVDPGRQIGALLVITPEDAREHFDLLEKWATVGRPGEQVSRDALYAIAKSEHPRSLDVLIEQLRTGRRGDALSALADHRQVPGVCTVLSAVFVVGVDPDPGHEALLQRAMRDGPLACRRHLEPFSNVHPERVNAVLGER